MSDLATNLEQLAKALGQALSSQNQNMVRATAALVAQRLQEEAECLKMPKFLAAEKNGELEIVAIDLRGIIPHKGKVS